MADQKKAEHKKGKLLPGKVIRNWRILVGIDKLLNEEVIRLGFSSKPDFLNNLLTRYFNGETIKRDVK